MKYDLELAKQIANMNKEFIVVFEGDDIIMTNKSFNKFFGVSSTQEYKRNFGAFVNNFVPHPSYFNAEKINEGETWFESILQLDEIDRVVSFISQNHEPHAFSVSLNQEVEGLQIATFEDITQDLIKRIMISNNANIDAKSGAYTKQYFLQIKKSYEEAALFNEKIIGITMIEISRELGLGQDNVKTFVETFLNSIRKDDMLVKWADDKFLLAFLVDDDEKAAQVTAKLKEMFKQCKIDGFSYELSSIWQKEKESIAKLISKLNS